MRYSLYNLFVPCRKGFAAFNTLRGSILFVDEEMKGVLESEAFDCLKGEDITALKKLGFIVEDHFDERKIVSYRMKSFAYSSAHASISVLPTYACNLACPYCYEGKGEIHRGKMSEEMTEQVIKGIKAYCLKNGVQNLGMTLYGGEPLLHKKASFQLVQKLGEWAEPQGIQYSCNMITNGTLLTREALSECEPYLKMIQLTLDGPQQYHDKRRVQKNGEGTYARIMQAVQTARENEIAVMLRIQVAKDNMHMMDALFCDLAERDMHTDNGIHAYVFPLMDINEVCSSYASLCCEEDVKILPELWRTARKYGFNIVSKPVQVFISPYCSFASNQSFLIDAYGDVYKCVSVVGDTAYKAARMSEEGLKEITPEFYAFMTRDPSEIAECRDCVLLPVCGGGCARRAYQKYGTYQKGDCSLHKGLEQEKLLLYLEKNYPDRFG